MTAHPITLDMLEEGHTLLLGQTRSGKTYQLRGILERLRRADRRVGAIDKLGNHWGLTLSVGGDRPGLDFVIFGGKRAHVPMTPTDGARLGQLFVQRNIPAIFDLSQWHDDDQQAWVADFADAVFLHNEGALHLVMDEAPGWIPQQEERGDAFRPVRRLTTQGLGNGIRVIMASQGWAQIDKTSARMASLIVTMRQFGSDFASMRKFLPVTPAELRPVEQDLPSLPPGTGYVWDPVPGTLTKYAFPPNTTFDSSRTPRHGDTPPPAIAVSGSLVEELRELLAPAVPAEGARVPVGMGGGKEPDDREATIEDLRAANALLEATVRELARERDDALLALNRERSAFLGGVTAAVNDLARLRERIERGNPAAKLHAQNATSKSTPARQQPASKVEDAPVKGNGARRGKAGASTDLNRTAIEVAEYLKALAPDGFEWNDILLSIGRRPNSGDSRKARKALTEQLLIDTTGHLVVASGKLLADDGFGMAHVRCDEELIELWAEKLRGPGGDILRNLAEHGPASSRAVADRLGKSATSGWWRQGLKDLKNSNLVRDVAGELTLHPLLQGDG